MSAAFVETLEPSQTIPAEPAEERVWAQSLRRTELELKEAVRAVGNSAFAVQAYLRRKHQRRAEA